MGNRGLACLWRRHRQRQLQTALQASTFPTGTCRFIFAYIGEILIRHHNWERAEAAWEKFGGWSLFLLILATFCPFDASFHLRIRGSPCPSFSRFLSSVFCRPLLPRERHSGIGLLEGTGCLEYDLFIFSSPFLHRVNLLNSAQKTSLGLMIRPLDRTFMFKQSLWGLYQRVCEVGTSNLRLACVSYSCGCPNLT